MAKGARIWGWISRWNTLGNGKKIGRNRICSIPRLEGLEEKCLPAFLTTQLPGLENNLPSVIRHLAPESLTIVSPDVYSSLPKAELSGSTILVLDPLKDGFQQIQSAVTQFDNLETIRMISHGTPGAVQLGSTRLDEAFLQNHLQDLSTWKSHLAKDAEVLFYGCSVAANSTGREFVNTFSQLTGTDVAASSNPTGYHGDLNLEYTTGPVQAKLLASPSDWHKAGLQLDPTATTTVLASNVSSSHYGDQEYIDATVTGPGGAVVNNGTVDLKDGSTLIASVSLNSLGHAVFTTSTLKVASYHLTAYYSGDATYGASSSSALDYGITKKDITGDFVVLDKNYDGKRDVDLILSADLTGVINGDNVGLEVTSASFSDKNAGVDKSVVANSYQITGSDKDNYNLTKVNDATATISPLSLSGTFSVQNKVYDGNSNATVVGGSADLSGVLTGDLGKVTLVVSAASFDSKNVNTSKPVTADTYQLQGTEAGNYAVTVSATTGDITAKDLHIQVSGNNKTYDGTKDASISITNDRISGDDLSFSYTASEFADKNIGTGKSISVSGISISGGNDANNYNLVDTSASTSANISARTLNVTASASNKTYDGTTTAGITISDDRASGDNIVISYTSAQFPDKNAGKGKTITISGLSYSGTDLGNYTVVGPTASADITARPITVTADTLTKAYGDSTPALTYQITSGSLVSGESITGSLSRAAGETPGIYAISQNTLSAGSNYYLTYGGANLTITARALVITADNQVKTYGDGLTPTGGEFTSSGLVNSDSLTGVTISSSGFGALAAPGTFGITPSGATGSGLSNYAITYVNGTLTVNKAQPVIIWSNPNPITLGTPLGTTQLSAIVSGVLGGESPSPLVYDFPLGAILGKGTQTITVSSAASAYYEIASKSVSLIVNDSISDPNPSAGNGFGTLIVTLANGNVVVTAPFDDAGGTDAGAVYLFNGSTGKLISTLLGAQAGDNIGLTGVTTLSNGNYVIRSANWQNGTQSNAGAVTFGSSASGVNGTVNSSNSLIGGSANDQVGQLPIIALSNGNYVVGTPGWDSPSLINVGAVTFGSKTTGISGLITSENSLIGSHRNDMVGSSGITALSNGNYVVRSELWDNGSVGDAGAITLASGIAGIQGEISTSNSIIGSTDNDLVGNGSVTALTNGNLVVSSPNWQNNGGSASGAVTLINGSTGKTIEDAFGPVSTTNSLVGSPTSYGDQVGYNGIVALPNGNYVVLSSNWNDSRGAATWGNGTAGVYGEVTSSNSLVGNDAGATIGSGGVTALPNGNYIVTSYNWSTNKGAVTFGDGTHGTNGVVGSSTSLVGTTNNSYVGLNGVTLLSNNNFVVKSSLWIDGTNAAVGAATFVSGSTGITGEVSSSNSLVGSHANDRVGAQVTALTNGNYLVVSSQWGNGSASAAGAVTWASGTAGVSGTINSSNSLIGSKANDQVGSGGIISLTNGNYVVNSPLWDNGSTTDVGAVTWANGSTGTNGQVGTSNSLAGSQSSDRIGSGGVTALTNGNYIISSPLWDNGSVTNTGAVTWVNGSSSTSATVSTQNSLVGSQSGDSVGGGGVVALGNGNYVIVSPLWDNGSVTNAGAVTLGNGTTGLVATVSSTNSLVGSTANDMVGKDGIKTLLGNNYLVVSKNWTNGSLGNAGAVTWASGSTGLVGAVSSTNSTVGTIANAGLKDVTLNATSGTYLVKFLGTDEVSRLSYSYQNPGSPVFTNAATTTFTIGQAKTFIFQASGGPKASFSLVSGTVPSGLSFDYTNGTLSGTASTGTSGTYNLIIRASNGTGQFVDQSFALIVA